MGSEVFRGRIFDGSSLFDDHRLVLENRVVDVFEPAQGLCSGETKLPPEIILHPGFVDLQVNGGGGFLFNDDPSLATLKKISDAHLGLGTVGLLPTLISDTPEKTKRAIEAVRNALHCNLPGILGLHLEGPHLAPSKRGAHALAHIREMTEADLALLLEAAADLPNIMVTVAPENTTQAQVTALSQAGVIVSLGHTDADYGTCMAFFEAGASCVTHLFNAMSQLQSRAPGLVGAALQSGLVTAGVIADGHHVDPVNLGLLWAMKGAPERLFLVSDSMATAGSEMTSFELNGRQIQRSGGTLRLSDGTLAGADLDLGQAVRVLIKAGIPEEAALRAAITTPKRVLRSRVGCESIQIGKRCRPMMLELH